ncbi:hypothetical protein P692DRAFT_20230738 [Suillus brevipes Sb2]|nr:hypothetical protein P692DRAFT_20230738 [Suillus brevipes Sb2]
MLATVLELFFFCQRRAKLKCWTPNRESLLLSPTIRVGCLRICGCDTIVLFDVIRTKLLQDLNSYFCTWTDNIFCTTAVHDRTGQTSLHSLVFCQLRRARYTVW